MLTSFKSYDLLNGLRFSLIRRIAGILGKDDLNKCTWASPGPTWQPPLSVSPRATGDNQLLQHLITISQISWMRGCCKWADVMAEMSLHSSLYVKFLWCFDFLSKCQKSLFFEWWKGTYDIHIVISFRTWAFVTNAKRPSKLIAESLVVIGWC